MRIETKSQYGIELSSSCRQESKTWILEKKKHESRNFILLANQEKP